MKTKPATSILLVILLLLGVAVALADEKQVSDDSIYDNVRRKLASDSYVKGGALEVDVQQGVVTLKGTVELEKQKTKAEKIAQKVDGVKKVVNQLEVRHRAAR